MDDDVQDGQTENGSRKRSNGHKPKGINIHALDELPREVREADATLVRYVRERPLLTLGVALGAGYLLGRIARRVF